jgi:GT2 family glycosyltransferase
MKISVIIPNYNGENLLEKNLPKVIEALTVNNDYEIELVLTDDASVDDSIKVAKNILASVKKTNFTYKILKNDNNLGFSSNVNNGVSASTGEILVLLNTDIIPERNFLEPLIGHFADEKIFAIGCMDKSVEDGKVRLRGRGVGNWKKGLLVHGRGEVNKNNTLWVSCGSGAFRKETWDKLGGLDRLYNPFYWEDLDLSYRALKSGYRIAFESKSVVLHEHEKGAIKSKYSPFKVRTLAYRNQFIFAWKNATDLNLRMLILLYTPYHLLNALVRLDLSLIIGFFGALILLPEIIKSSIKAKKFFIKKDKELIAEFNK